MTITENKTPISIELVVAGRLDTGTAPELEVKLKEVAPQTQTLYLNMKDVSYISSAGLRMIHIIYKTLSDQNGSMYIKNPNQDVKNVFEISGFQTFLNII